MRTRVKICGITRREDALAAIEAGADALGFVFYPPSRRHVSVSTARQLMGSLPPFVSRVALFVDPSAEQVIEVIDELRPDLLQFHGNESEDFCACFQMPYLKAVPMREGLEAAQAVIDAHARAAGFLLDSHGGGKSGGSGTRFDWSSLPDARGKPVLLAGGLDALSVAEAVRRVRPYAVDVSSGVESAPGVKDPVRMKALIQEVMNVSQS